jgi:putative transposase
MRGPQPPSIELTDIERQELETLVRRHTTPQQLALRARIVLKAADGANNSQIARQLGANVDTARLWRQRWRALQPARLDDLPLTDRLTDAPRPGKPRRITDEVQAVACEAPERAGRPISQWTAREIAFELKQRGIVEEISDRHAARLLRRGISNRI